MVLPHHNGAVFKLCRKMQTLAHNGQNHAARLQQTAQKSQHRPKNTFVMQVAACQNQVAHTGPEWVKIGGHALQKKIEVQAQGIGKQGGHICPDWVCLATHAAQLVAQKLWVSMLLAFIWQSAGAKLHDSGGHNGAVGQGQQTVAYVAHCGHGKRTPQGGRAAAGIKGRYQMNRIVRVVDQLAAKVAQGRAARKKNKSWTQRRKTERRRIFAHTELPAASISPSGRASQRLRQEGISPISHMRKKISRPIQASVAA